MHRTKSELMLHPIRMSLLTELTGRSMTSQQLAAALPDVSQATLYRQIKILVDGGLFETIAEHVVNGATERTYAVAQGQGRLSPEDLESMSVRDHKEAFQLFVATLGEHFAQYIDQADLSRLRDDGMSFNGTAIYLSDEERAAFQKRLMETVSAFAELGPAENRKRFTLASIVIPENRS